MVLISLGSLVYGMRYLEWSSTPLQASFLNPEQFSDGNSVKLLLARLWTGLNGTYSGMMSMWFQRAMLIATTSWLKMASCPSLKVGNSKPVAVDICVCVFVCSKRKVPRQEDIEAVICKSPLYGF